MDSATAAAAYLMSQSFAHQAQFMTTATAAAACTTNSGAATEMASSSNTFDCVSQI